MKFLKSGFDDVWQTHKFVFQNRAVERQTLAPNSAAEILENVHGGDFLYRFNYSHLKEVERNKSLLDSAKKRQKFQVFCEHWIRIYENSESTARKFPPQMLYLLEHSPSLNPILTPNQKQRLKSIFESEKFKISEMKKEDESPAELRPAQIVRMGQYFRSLDRRSEKTTFEKNLHKRMQKDLLGWGVQIFAAAAINPDRSFSSAEELAVIQLQQIFPKNSDWTGRLSSDSQIVQTVVDQVPGTNPSQVVSLFAKNFEDARKTLPLKFAQKIRQNKSQMELGFLVPLVHEVLSENKNAPLPSEFSEICERANAGIFLLGIQEKNQLMPAQFALLEKIQNTDFPVIELESNSEAVSEFEKALEKIRDEKIALEKERTTAAESMNEDSALQKIANSKTQQQIKNTKTKYLGSCSDLKKTAKNLVAKIKTAETQMGIDLESGKIESLIGKINSTTDFSEIHFLHSERDRENLEKTLEILAQKVAEKAAEDSSNAISFDNEKTGFFGALKSFLATREKFSGLISGANGAESDQIAQKSEAIKKKETDLKSGQDEMAAENEFRETIRNLNKKSGEKLEKFESALTSRANRRVLLASDFAIFYQNSNVAEKIIGEKKFGLIDEFRQKFESAVVADQSLSNALADAKNEADISVIFFNFLSNWKSQEKNLWQQLQQNDLSAETVYEGVLLNYREHFLRILGSAADKNNFEHQRKQAFLNSFSALHYSELSDGQVKDLEKNIEKNYQLKITESENVATEFAREREILALAFSENLYRICTPQTWKPEITDPKPFFDQMVAAADEAEFEKILKSLLADETSPLIQVAKKAFRQHQNRMASRDSIKKKSQKNLQKGFIDGENFWSPGTDQLRTLSLSFGEVAGKMGQNFEDLKSSISEVQKILQRDKEDISPQKIAEKNQAVGPDLRLILARWQTLEIEMNLIVGPDGEAARMISSVLEINLPGQTPQEKAAKEKFRDYFLESLKKVSDEIKAGFQGFKQAAESNHHFTGAEVFWQNLPRALNDFQLLFDFENGFWARQSQKNSDQFTENHRGVEIFRKFGGLDFDPENTDPDGHNFKNFSEKFEIVRREFSEKVSKYEDSVREIKRKLGLDMKKMSDGDFFAKHKISKMSVENMLAELDSTNKNFDDLWQKFRDPNFCADFESRLKNGIPLDPEGEIRDPETIKNSAFDQLVDWENISDRVTEMHHKTNEYLNWIDKYNEGTKTGLPIKIQWISIYGLYQIAKQVLEAREKNWKRSVDRSVANVGQMLFGANSKMGKEFLRMGEQSEEERIGEYKKQWGDRPKYRWREVVRTTRDVDELRALFDLMNENGILKWDDPDILRALVRVGSKQKFNIPEDAQTSDMIGLRAKIKRACISIWSEKVFDDWDQAIDSGIEKKFEGYQSEFQASTRTRQSPEVLWSILKMWESNNLSSDEVDPVKYEAFIKLAVEQGKMSIEDKFFFIIMGVTTKNKFGQPLISQDAFQRFEKLMVNMPQLEFFTDVLSYKKDGRVYPEDVGKKIGARAGGWEYEDYMCWRNMISRDNLEDSKKATGRFITSVVEESETVKIRHERTTSDPKKLDHDDFASRFAGLTQATLDNWMKNASDGAYSLRSPDCYRCLLKGAAEFFERKYLHILELQERYKDYPEIFQSERKRQLQLVGEKMRIALLLEQMLKGNALDKESRAGGGDRTFNLGSRNDWELNNAYNYSAAVSSEKILDLAEDIFKRNNLKEKEETDYMAAIQVEGFKEPAADAKKKRDKVSGDFLREEKFSVYFTGNLENVWKSLETQAQKRSWGTNI